MTSDNLRAFELQIERFESELPEQHRQRTQEIALDTLSGIVEGTPIDTGFAVNNWNVSLDMPDFTTAKVRPAPLTRALITMQNLKAFQDVYIANGALYISELEDGHSDQAPYGMVDVTLVHIRSKYGL